VLTPDEADGRAGLVSFRLEDRDAGALCARLHSQHAITVRYVPHFNAVRISMSQFTSEAHLERLMGALAAPDA
jgi:selenocysteine lyase/cysteine desulfurase